jgi:hypothetical protein
MPWTELGRANRHRVSIDFGLVGPSQGRGPFANFISKPAYEPGDVPRFDKCRFVTMVARDHINGFGGGEPRSGPRGAALPATWEGGNKSEPSAKVTRPAKSYEQLGRAARPVDAEGNPRPPWDPKYNYVLGGWFLRRALKKGFSEGEEAVLKADNSKYKKHLRKMAKRKPK